jgi:thioredoxin reductase
MLLDRIGKSEAITYFSPATLISIDRVKENCLSVVINHDGREKSLEVDHILYAIGRAPCKDFYSPRLMEMQRDLIANSKLFEVGDVKNGFFRQIAISVGNGIEAAMRINQKLVMVKNENNCQNS